MVKCSECEFKKFSDGNGNPGRYYCYHPDAPPGHLSLICRTERGKTDLTIKTTKKWCPLKNKK